MPQSLVGAVVPAAQGLHSQLGSSFTIPTLPKEDPPPHTGCAHPNLTLTHPTCSLCARTPSCAPSPMQVTASIQLALPLP